MRGEPFQNASYYFWKWADDDLPGPPGEVHTALLRGDMHAALQIFDARPLLRALEKAAANGRLLGAEWDWQLNPPGDPAHARFVFVSCPKAKKRDAQGIGAILPPKMALGLAVFDESAGATFSDSFPKLNCLKSGQFATIYDVAGEKLPALLRRLSSQSPNPYAILANRHGDFAQCLKKGRKYFVEWRENYEFRKPGKFDQWRAFDPERADTGDPATDEDLLRWPDMLAIMQMFMRDEPRPARYAWRNINDKLP